MERSLQLQPILIPLIIMNKDTLKIVFMGTPDFAVETLKTLVDNNYNIVGVITAPDKPAGRGRKLNESAVKKYAVANGLKVLQPTNLKNEDFIDELKALNDVTDSTLASVQLELALDIKFPKLLVAAAKVMEQASKSKGKI